jgi:hypothetical protein
MQQRRLRICNIRNIPHVIIDFFLEIAPHFLIASILDAVSSPYRDARILALTLGFVRSAYHLPC